MCKFICSTKDINVVITEIESQMHSPGYLKRWGKCRLKEIYNNDFIGQTKSFDIYQWGNLALVRFTELWNK